MATTEKTTDRTGHGARHTEPDFGQLLQNVRHGDENALHCLLERTDGIARSLARKECFFQAWGRDDSYSIARAGLLQFLFTFKGDIRNRTFYGLVKTYISRYLISQLRKDGKYLRRERPVNFKDAQGEALLNRTAPVEETPETECLRRDQKEVLWQEVRKLPPEEQRILVLHYRDGLPLREIADRTGRHINTIYKYHRRALQKLRGVLQPFRE
ncbi:MAG: sigma-70 family RNA polymerase sigma factor [Succiniclasticum sp.]|nr:sigma-70 family RNA polymerase sigma factor [Succiniclasticum sp.]MEE3478681.1 sigma-70 family RNA polymerase sigma factor [Succiniclasticum sp.]